MPLTLNQAQHNHLLHHGMKMYCPFDREEVTMHIGIEAWLAEKATEAFSSIKF